MARLGGMLTGITVCKDKVSATRVALPERRLGADERSQPKPLYAELHRIQKTSKQAPSTIQILSSCKLAMITPFKKCEKLPNTSQ